MQQLYKNILISTVILLLLDAAFISINMNAFENQVALVQRVIMQVNPVGAVLCYFFLIFGLNYFIISKHRSVLEAFIFGLVIYGVYDTTNFAMFKKWDPYLAMMDTLWGGTLMATTTYLTNIVAHM